MKRRWPPPFAYQCLAQGWVHSRSSGPTWRWQWKRFTYTFRPQQSSMRLDGLPRPERSERPEKECLVHLFFSPQPFIDQLKGAGTVSGAQAASMNKTHKHLCPCEPSSGRPGRGMGGQWSSQQLVAFCPHPPGHCTPSLQSTPTYMFLVTGLHPPTQPHPLLVPETVLPRT